MITAVQALALDRAQLSEDDRKLFFNTLDEIDEHIRKTMHFSGSEPLNVPLYRMNATVARAICLRMLKYGWGASASLQAMPPRVQGAPPTPSHWMFQFAPTNEAYAEAGVVPEVLLQ